MVMVYINPFGMMRLKRGKWRCPAGLIPLSLHRGLPIKCSHFRKLFPCKDWRRKSKTLSHYESDAFRYCGRGKETLNMIFRRLSEK